MNWKMGLVVGAILRRGIYLAPLRSQIAHWEEKEAFPRGEGIVALKLFNLLIDELGLNLLERDIIFRQEDPKTFFMSLPENFGARTSVYTVSRCEYSLGDWTANARSVSFRQNPPYFIYRDKFPVGNVFHYFSNFPWGRDYQCTPSPSLAHPPRDLLYPE